MSRIYVHLFKVLINPAPLISTVVVYRDPGSCREHDALRGYLIDLLPFLVHAGGLLSSERSIGLGMTVDERMLYGSARSPGSLLGRSNVPLVGSMGDGSLHSSYRPFLTHDQHNLSASLRMTPGASRRFFNPFVLCYGHTALVRLARLSGPILV